MLIGKIVSGGQTGVQRGALAAAMELGFPYGGMVPKGRLAEDGRVPERFDRMSVAPRKDYLYSAEWNVTRSDATLVISREPVDMRYRIDIGSSVTQWTVKFCIDHGKPHVLITRGNVPAVLEWLQGMGKDGIVLNVSGPAESVSPGIEKTSSEFISKLIRRVKESA